VQGVIQQPPEQVYQVKDVFEPKLLTLRPFRGDIVMLNGASFFHTVEKGKLLVFKVSLYDINKAIEAEDVKERPLEEIVPEQYHEFLALLNTGLEERLPPHRPGIDYEV
jgi:hypothetical protein